MAACRQLLFRHELLVPLALLQRSDLETFTHGVVGVDVVPHAVIVLTQKKLPGVSVSRCDARCSLRLVLVWCRTEPSCRCSRICCGKAMCRTPLAASFGAALLLYSKAFKKPSLSSSSIKLSSKSCSLASSVYRAI